MHMIVMGIIGGINDIRQALVAFAVEFVIFFILTQGFMDGGVNKDDVHDAIMAGQIGAGQKTNPLIIALGEKITFDFLLT